MQAPSRLSTSHPISSLIFTDEAIENARPLMDRARQSMGILGDIETSRRSSRRREVSPVETPVAEGPGEGRLQAMEQKWVHGEHWHERSCVEEGMELAGYGQDQLDRFHECGKNCHIFRRVSDGKLRVKRWRCKHRLCRKCSKSVALRVGDNLVDAVEPHRRSMSMLTLTLRHSDEPLLDQRKRLYEAFRKLRKCTWWKRLVRGGVFFFQNHRSRSDGRWHPHAHCILWARYIPQWLLVAEWAKITGDSTNVFIEGVRESKAAAQEVSRYVAAPLGKTPCRSPQDVAEILLATDGARLAFTFGVWPGPALHAKRPNLEPSDEEYVAPLGLTIWRARQGDSAAAKLLEELMLASHPKTGPPDSLHHPLIDMIVSPRATG